MDSLVKLGRTILGLWLIALLTLVVLDLASGRSHIFRLAEQAAPSFVSSFRPTLLGRLFLRTVPPSNVLEYGLVVPPNYTELGYNAAFLVEGLDSLNVDTSWEALPLGAFILRIAGTHRLTNKPYNGAIQLRFVNGPGEVSSQVKGFDGPAVVVEQMAEDGQVLNYMQIYATLSDLNGAASARGSRTKRSSNAP
jgi:hypothetical protein